MQPIAIRCQNVANAWIDTLENCGQPARVFFPYVTNLAERALRSNHPQHVQVYTCFDVAAFASGASSLRIVRWLVETGYPVFHLAKLHAKVFEHPESGFATVGSQNLTNGGMKNREATVIIRDLALLGKLKVQLDRWTAKRQPITLEMLADAEPAVAEYRRALKALAGKCRRVEKEVFAAQAKRDEAARKKAEKEARERLEREKAPLIVTPANAMKRFVFRNRNLALDLPTPVTVAALSVALDAKTYQVLRILIEAGIFYSKDSVLSTEQAAAVCETYAATLENEKHQLARLSEYQRIRNERLERLVYPNDGVPHHVCYQIAWEAFDVKITGRTGQAHRDANHLHPGKYGWEIRLGGKAANRFSVALAITWCRNALAVFFPENDLRSSMLGQAEKDHLAYLVRGAVIDHKDKPYNGTYPIQPDGSLKLGNHYLKPARTVEEILKFSGFNQPIFVD